MASTLPASASLLAAAPAAAPGIFSAAAPALGGLSAGTVIPTVAAKSAATGLGSIFANAAPALGGLPAGTVIPGLGSGITGAVPSLAGAVQTIPAASTPLLQAAGANPLFGANQLAASTNLAKMQGSMLNAINQNVAGGLGSLSPSAFNAPLTEAAKLQAIGGGTTQTINTALNKAAADANIANMNTAVQNAVNQNVAGGAATTSPGMAAGPAPYTPASPIISGQNFLQNLGNLIKDPSMQGAKDYVKEHPYATAAAGYAAYNALKPKEAKPKEQDKGMIRPYEFAYNPNTGAYDTSPLVDSSERTYFNPMFTPLEPYKAAEGGIMALAVGGPVETMSAMNAVGGNMMYPQAGLQTPMYSNPMMQRPEPVNVISPSGDAGVGAYTGEARFAGGGVSDLGGYSDGGRLLKGPGDGVSDSIPAVIGERQPARLADGEFVIPARIVSELGNGSTEAGARKLYAMMDRVQKARGKTVGKDRVAANTKADKHLPA
jgi:hypothetical protein